MATASPILIGIGGWKGSGKNALANFIAGHFPIGAAVFEQVSFAQPLKDFAYGLFGSMGLRPAQYYEAQPSLKEKNLAGFEVSPRDIWKMLGRFGEHIWPEVWIHLMEKKISQSARKVILISDVRFPKEVDFIKRQNGILVKVIRDSIPAPAKGDMTEYSLSSFNGWDMVVNNNGTLGDLFEAAALISKMIYQRIKNEKQSNL